MRREPPTAEVPLAIATAGTPQNPFRLLAPRSRRVATQVDYRRVRRGTATHPGPAAGDSARAFAGFAGSLAGVGRDLRPDGRPGVSLLVRDRGYASRTQDIPTAVHRPDRLRSEEHTSELQS